MIYYVGKSSTGAKRPRRSHAHGRCKGWLRELQSVGLTPCVIFLEEVDSQGRADLCWWWVGRKSSPLNDAERWWIAYGRALGWPLTNVKDGGEGGKGLRHTAAAKEAIGKASRNQRLADWKNPEYRQKITEAFRESKRSLESRARSSKQAKAQWENPDLAARMRENLRGAHTTPEFREKLRKISATRPIDYYDKMRAAKRARLQDPEWRKQVALANRKSKTTPEALARSRISSAAVWLRPGQRERLAESIRVHWSVRRVRALYRRFPR